MMNISTLAKRIVLLAVVLAAGMPVALASASAGGGPAANMHAVAAA